MPEGRATKDIEKQLQHGPATELTREHSGPGQYPLELPCLHANPEESAKAACSTHPDADEALGCPALACHNDHSILSSARRQLCHCPQARNTRGVGGVSSGVISQLYIKLQAAVRFQKRDKQTCKASACS